MKIPTPITLFFPFIALLFHKYIAGSWLVRTLSLMLKGPGFIDNQTYIIGTGETVNQVLLKKRSCGHNRTQLERSSSEETRFGPTLVFMVKPIKSDWCCKLVAKQIITDSHWNGKNLQYEAHSKNFLHENQQFPLGEMQHLTHQILQKANQTACVLTVPHVQQRKTHP